ncbi:MAG: TetR/AcrR family transcriptional regulator C-terminal domain-containing protein [Candidatus Devosia phytovorans]|uniref:TetR/AcrR family transcriptional regulator C-terminal domain-containing protein n=1 Tax=Candidatus Devosia phytovorans TaxID=3121372 RepID=A0AAJ5VZ78_9HYPH|nr:TetR/AcrR family transcriptional regulator C-terminal domain-containing protein [Devosia sp.]WEK06154.1 MAG: TetR/AcrR family transcriptional regulator C-terminal domain-containing protein [Devosia sp.]
MAIDRDRIIDEAMLLLDEVGIDKLSTRKLAERLGVQQPALYWHFKNKSALLDALNAEMLKRHYVDRLPSPSQDWAEFTLASARSQRRALLAVRDGARLTAGTRPTVADFADTEKQLQLYVDAGFTPQEALHVAMAVARYVVGYVLEEQGERAREAEEAGEAPGNLRAELEPYPLMASAVISLVSEGTINTERAFETGLRFLVDGMRASLGRLSH